MRAAWLLVLAACGGDNGKSVDAAIASDAAPDACVAGAGRIVFLNRGGGTYMKGADNPATNTSSILDMTRTLAPPTTTAPDWTTVLACVQTKLAAYPITVTDVDPTTAPHIEVVIIDNGNQIGVPGLVSGAAASPCVGGFGTALTNTIAFAAWLGDNGNRCWDLSQAIGYTLGLDNVTTCADLMSVSPSCSITGKLFTNVDQPCGEVSPRACRCGGTMQNAAARIAANVGASCP